MPWHPDATDIQALIDGELDAHARRGLEAHLRGCARCAALAARLRGVSQVLCAIPRATAPAGLHEKIVSAVASAPRVVEPACAECAEMASAYVDGELSGADRDAFEAHVFGCPTCYAALKHIEGTAEVLRTTPRHAAPDDLFERITAAVAAEHDRMVRFTWRRALAVGAGLAAAAAIMAAVLLPGGRAPKSMVTPPETVARQSAETPATEPSVAAAPVAEAPETVAPRAVIAEPSAVTEAPVGVRRVTRAGEVARPVRRSPDAASPVPVHTDAEARVAAAPPLPHDTVSGGSVAPVLPPATTPRAVHRPQPAPTLVAPSPAPAPPVSVATPEPAAPQPQPAPIAPAETAVALAPRTTGPEARVGGPVSVPVPPVPDTAGATGSRTDEPVRLAVVPRQQGARTLYRGSSQPAEDAIARARVAMARGQSLGFDDPRTGIALR